MSDALSFAELYGQHGELLPARTVLSTFITADPNGSSGGSGSSSPGDLLAKVFGSINPGAAPDPVPAV